MTLLIEEGERQAILLALAKLSLSRPGWHDYCLAPIAEKLGGREMYETFRSHGPDAIIEKLSARARYRFRWRADNEDHVVEISADGYPLACLALGNLHKEKYGTRIPADFSLNLTRPEVVEETA